MPIIAALSLLAVACSCPAPAANEDAAAGRTSQWRQDLDVFAARFPAVHIDFAKLWDRKAFDAAIGALRANIESLSDAEITLRLVKLVASAHVAHTRVGMARVRQFHRLPLTFTWFSDGMAVIGAAPAYREAIGTRVLRIGARTPEELLPAVAPYVSYETDAGLRAGVAERLRTVEILQAVGAARADGRVDVTIAKPGGDPVTLTIGPGDAAAPALLGLYDTLHIPEPLFRKNGGRFYWYEYLADAQALYIQYATCQEDPKQPFAAFAREVFAFAESHPVKRVIVDLRFNGGGNSRVMEPLIDGFKSRPALRSKLAALIGPETFSSAVINGLQLQQVLHAQLLGEPASEKLNSYGEVRVFELPNSKLQVQYSTKFFRLANKAGDAVFAPRVTIARTLSDVLSGLDPVLEAALQN